MRADYHNRLVYALSAEVSSKMHETLGMYSLSRIFLTLMCGYCLSCPMLHVQKLITNPQVGVSRRSLGEF